MLLVRVNVRSLVVDPIASVVGRWWYPGAYATRFGRKGQQAVLGRRSARRSVFFVLFFSILFVFSVDHGSTFRDGSSCEISFGTAKLECYAHSGLVPARVLDV